MVTYNPRPSMHLDREFIQLPLTFDVRALCAEVEALGEDAWRPHPEGHRGNWALPLVAVDGNPENDGVKGRMQPTPHLVRSPYLRRVLGALGAPIGRTRLMRIDGNSEATEHVDVNYYWQQRVRVHVPIVTDPAVVFTCGSRAQHMAPGQCWIFDTWRRHNVINPNPTRRIHLVADTAGSPSFQELLSGDRETEAVAFEPHRDVHPPIEVHNYPLVMTPAEMQGLFEILEPELRSSEAARALRQEVSELIAAWTDLFRRHAEAPVGWRDYAENLERAERRLELHVGTVTLANGVDAAFAVRQFILAAALNTDLASGRRRDGRAARNRFDRPVFIVSSPRSGSSLLYETLAQSPDLFSIGGESHAVIEGIEALHPRAHGWDSNRLGAADAADRVAEELADRFAGAAVDRGNRSAQGRFRFLEKTPKNSLRVPFLRAMFPDAFFIYLYRDERATMSSMLEAWRSGRFVTYPELPDWDGPPWSLLLVPGWRELKGKPLPEIVARQWETATRLLLDDLEALPKESWCVASYDHLIAEPAEEILRLCQFVGVRWDRQLTVPLPQSRHTLTPPDPGKWRANFEELEPWLSPAAPTVARARDLFARSPLQRAAPPAPAKPHESEDPQSFRSVHTSNVPQILKEIRSSLLVSTYQSGRVVVIRADGNQLNTHFRVFPSAMGIAVGEGRIAIGTLREVWDYWNVPAAAARLHPQKHDACFLPRNMHVTGDIRIHEVAFGADGELWMINTRFSALCTFDSATSFVPRWRPHFITQLAPEDRCHLNGLCMDRGRPRFVTALGATNTREGWREKKASGGILMDVASNEIVISGLSMPHSPRLHDGKLWLLESAKGTLVRVDPSRGSVETIAELPGFTRGLAFAGPLAFIGLSQVRESVFDGIPLGQRLKPEERSCGIWIVDTRNGRVLGFVRFEGDVQEIFDVQLLPGILYPELLELGEDIVGASFVLSDEALRDTVAERADSKG
jgi:uncharacterized protein (TIGR03032 family)